MLTALTPKNLLSLKQFPKLESCFLAVKKEDLGLVGRLKELSQLREVRIHDEPHASLAASPLGESEWQEIAQLPLRSLWIDYGYLGIKTDRLERLAAQSKIEHLRLSSCRLDDAGVQALSKFSNLSSIDFHYFHLPNESVHHLANLKSLRELKSAGTRMTDATLTGLAKVRQLRRLDLRGELKLTESAIRKLAESLPKCRIEWHGGVIER